MWPPPGDAEALLACAVQAFGRLDIACNNAARHGVDGPTKMAAPEYATLGLPTNTVGPGFIDTLVIAALEGDAAVDRALVASIRLATSAGPKKWPNWCCGPIRPRPRS